MLLLSLVVAACAPTGPVSEGRFCHLYPAHPRKALSKAVLAGGLTVDYGQADPLRSGRAVLYGDHRQLLRLKRYRYEFWVDQPPRMVR
jgi:hypothetical protein